MVVSDTPMMLVGRHPDMDSLAEALRELAELLSNGLTWEIKTFGGMWEVSILDFEDAAHHAEDETLLEACRRANRIRLAENVEES